MNIIKQLELAISIGPTLVTILFVGLFLATLIWIFRPGSRRFYDQQAQLPLEDGAQTRRAPHATDRKTLEAHHA